MNEIINKTRMEINAARFFIGKDRIVAGKLSILGDDAKHISTVLRMREGDRIIVCDGDGMDYDCELTYAGENEVHAHVLNCFPSAEEPPVKVTLYQSLPKSDKIEYVIQKCVEGGVYEIIPVFSAFTQYADRLKGESGDKRLARWRRISHEAAKQSGRGIVPQIGGAISFTEAVDACARAIGRSPGSLLALIPYENEDKTTLKSALKEFKRRNSQNNPAPLQPQLLQRPQTQTQLQKLRQQPTACSIKEDYEPHIFIFIGPEGGFSPAEVTYCIQNHIMPVTLGPRILRTESAGFAVLCQIMYEFYN